MTDEQAGTPTPTRVEPHDDKRAGLALSPFGPDTELTGTTPIARSDAGGDLPARAFAGLERARVEIRDAQAGGHFFTRDVTIEAVRDAVDLEARTVEIAISSEDPYRRWWGIEILDHDPNGKTGPDLARMRDSAAFLADHFWFDQIGVIEPGSARIDPDRVLRATARFSRSERGEEMLQDVADGIRTKISVGYTIDEIELEKATDLDEDGEVATYRVTKWTPLEASLVSVPADTTVGVGRSAGTTQQKEHVTMTPEAATKVTDKAPAPAPGLSDEEKARIRAEKAEAEGTRVTEITRLGARHNRKDLADTAIEKGTSVERFKGILFDHMPDGTPIDTPASQVGLTDGEAKRYSLFKALSARHKNNWDGAELELEASQAVEKATGREARGFFVPHEAIVFPGRVARGERVVDSGGAAAGGSLIATDLLAGSFIYELYNNMQVRALGARPLPGLVGDIEIPRQNSSASAYWIDNEAEDVTPSNPVYGVLAMTPKTVAGRVDITRKMLLQSTPAVEGLVWDDLAMVLALAVDLAAINGAGGTEPTGILNTNGIGVVICGDPNGGPMEWSQVVDLETDVDTANAGLGNLAYLFNAPTKGKLKQTTKTADGASGFIWPETRPADGFATVNGNRAALSNQMPSNLSKGASGPILSAAIFGNWRDVLLGEWGILDLKPDEVTLGDRGGLVCRAFFDTDVGIRHAGSFSATEDIDNS